MYILRLFRNYFKSSYLHSKLV